MYTDGLLSIYIQEHLCWIYQMERYNRIFLDEKKDRLCLNGKIKNIDMFFLLLCIELMREYFQMTNQGRKSMSKAGGA